MQKNNNENNLHIIICFIDHDNSKRIDADGASKGIGSKCLPDGTRRLGATGTSRATGTLDNGVTINELKEAFSQLYAYTGFPRSLNALGVLSKVLENKQPNW